MLLRTSHAVINNQPVMLLTCFRSIHPQIPQNINLLQHQNFDLFWKALKPAVKI